MLARNVSLVNQRWLQPAERDVLWGPEVISLVFVAHMFLPPKGMNVSVCNRSAIKRNFFGDSWASSARPTWWILQWMSTIICS